MFVPVVHKFVLKLFQRFSFGLGATGLEEQESGGADQGVGPEGAVAYKRPRCRQTRAVLENIYF